MKAEITKLRQEMVDATQLGRQETSRSADKVRLDMCKFIENIKTLIERLAEKMKKLETVVAVVQKDAQNGQRQRSSLAGQVTSPQQTTYQRQAEFALID